MSFDKKYRMYLTGILVTLVITVGVFWYISSYNKGEDIYRSYSGGIEAGQKISKDDCIVVEGQKQPIPSFAGTAEAGKFSMNSERTCLYVENRVLPGADPLTFQRVKNSTHYFKDKHALYYEAQELVKGPDTLDIATFEGTTKPHAYSPYYVDKSHVYLSLEDGIGTLKVLDTVTPKDFSVLGVCRCVEKSCSYLYKDTSSFYCGDKKLEIADPAHFVYIGSREVDSMTSESVAKDGMCIYSAGVKMVDGAGVCQSPRMCTYDSLRSATACGPYSVTR